MKILLCTVPNGSSEGTIEPVLNPKGQNNAKHLIEPLGVLRIQSWIEKYGYNADIYDINNIRGTDDELIKNFKAYKPTVVGLGAGLTHCWPNVKRLSKILRELFPNIWIIVGMR